jgi:cytochrome c oxidase subunit 4
MESKVEIDVLYLVTAALLILLALTVALSFVDLGVYNFPAALAIATVKGLLVALFFMELRDSSQTTWIMAAAGLVWLFLLLAGTLADFLMRVQLSPPF